MKYIDPRGKVFVHLDRIVAWDRGDRPAPVTVEWDLSNRCTLGCQDCHFAHTHVRGPWTSKLRLLPQAFEQTGDLADTALVLATLPDLYDLGVKGIVWSGGGEPTTHPDWLKILERAAAVGLEQGMYTLGGLLTTETGPRLAQLATWIVVSLDCADAETYAREKGVPPARFDAACHGIRSLVGQRAAIGVSFLLHAENWSRCEAMVALARQLGATYTSFRPIIRTQPNQPSVCLDDRQWIAEAQPILQQLARASDVEVDLGRFQAYATWQGHGYAACTGIQLNTTITPDGRVWICPQRRGITPLGNLHEESFQAIWAKHPGQFTVDAGCRAMCRLHQVNDQLAAIRSARPHDAFI